MTTGTKNKKNKLAHVLLRNAVVAASAVAVFGAAASILLNVFTRHGKYIEVPEFGGMDIEQAREAARRGKLRIEINDSLYVQSFPGGMVLEQNPAAGSKVKSGRRVFVTLNSFRQKMVDVPYVAGYSLRQAKNNLELAGLGIDRIVYRPDMATNNVIEQRLGQQVITPHTKVKAEAGSGITLIVGWNAESRNPAVPKVAGFPLGEARSRLWEAGFNVGTVSYDDDIPLFRQKDARVYVQAPMPGLRPMPGAAVSLGLTLDRDKVDGGVASAERASRTEAQRQVEERPARNDTAAQE